MTFIRAARGFLRSSTGVNRSFGTSPSVHQPSSKSRVAPPKAIKHAELVPIYVLYGFVGLALLIGVHTATNLLFVGPSVQVSKRRREMVPEVDEAIDVAGDGKKFINRSFLRKLAHIQDSPNEGLQHANPYHRSPQDIESLHSVGVSSTNTR